MNTRLDSKKMAQSYENLDRTPMGYLKALDRWLEARVESETLEFKEAKFTFDMHTFDMHTVVRFCVAIANERGGHLILGVTDRFPREIVGTQAFALPKDLNALKYFILQQIHFRVNIEEVKDPNGCVLIFVIPARPVGRLKPQGTLDLKS
jgi:ATP-dependent DNA helicase RecG